MPEESESLFLSGHGHLRNTALRNAELREARWYQVDFLGAKFQVDKAKTAGGSGRVIPLNRTALDAFRQLRSRWPDAQPTDFIFPSEKLKFQGEGAAQRGVMVSYNVDRSKPLGSWKTAWRTAQKEAGLKRRIQDWRHHVITMPAETQTSAKAVASAVVLLPQHLSGLCGKDSEVAIPHLPTTGRYGAPGHDPRVE